MIFLAYFISSLEHKQNRSYKPSSLWFELLFDSSLITFNLLLSKSIIFLCSALIFGLPNIFRRFLGVNHLTGDTIGLLVSMTSFLDSFFVDGGVKDFVWVLARSLSFKVCLYWYLAELAWTDTKFKWRKNTSWDNIGTSIASWNE